MELPIGYHLKMNRKFLRRHSPVRMDKRYIERRESMKEPMIEITRASENWITGLIELGILEVTEEGVKCAEK